MLLVGKRDGREGLGFEADMDELEEGEACSYQDDVDPDVAFAYIDDKLHSVLGHFQKDFEGGVSAENLGAKFGGYGSFLPTYQRSPVGSHPRTPNIQNHALRSPSNLQHEGGFQSITKPDVATLPVHCRDISDTRALSTSKLTTAYYPAKLEAGIQPCQPKKHASHAETFKKSSLSDQKKFKVRIRVGSDNLPAQTKAEIYSGLGLHASPSSSVEDSPQSEEWSRELHDAPEESPNSILQMMTSFPLERSMLLSPLSKDLSYLTGNKKTRKERRPDFISNGETAKSNSITVQPGSSLNNGKLSVSKNNMSSKINGIPSELGNCSTGYAHDTIHKWPMETHEDASACEELISNALRLPLLSTSEIPVSNGKVADVFRSSKRNVISAEFGKIEPSDISLNRDDVWADKIYLGQKENIVGDFEAQPRKYFLSKGAVGSPGTKLNPSVEVKAAKQETANNQTSKTNTKLEYQKVGGTSVFKDIGSSKAKSKSKMSTGDTNTAAVSKAQAKGSSSFQSKIAKNTNRSSESGAKSIKLQNDVQKSRDTYKELFGELISEHDENEEEPLEFPSSHVMKCSDMTDIGKIASVNSLRANTTSKKAEKPITSESRKKTGFSNVPGVSDPMPVAPGPSAPVVIEEHWVCCDSCQKWRLLPAGKLPSNLPEKWLCSMLDWLPGMRMNRCDIEEDETTKALVSLYQASALPGGDDKNLQCNIRGNATNALPATTQHPSFRVNSVASTLKKKNGFTETVTAMSSQGLAAAGNPETYVQPEVKTKIRNDAKHFSSATDMINTYLKEPSDMAVEKTKKLSKDKQKLHELFIDQGNTGVVKANKKRGLDQGSPRPSKKYKNENSTVDGWISEMDHHVASRNGGLNSSKSTETESHSYPDTTMAFSMGTKHRVGHSADGSSDKRLNDGRGSSGKKRKANESQESRNSESLPTSGIQREWKNESSKDSNQRHHGKEKKARVSLPKRESITEQSECAVAKNLKPAQCPDNSLIKQSMEDNDSSKRGLTSSHLVMEANSSSSKISGSRKSKANPHVTEGSPVESVSSSPLRSRMKYRRASNGRNHSDKECPPDFSGLSDSPKTYSKQEIDDQNDVVRVDRDICSMEKASAISQKGTEFSSVLDFRDSVSGGTIKGNPATYDEFPGNQTVNEVVITLNQHAYEHQFSENGLSEEANNITFPNESLEDKKGSSMGSVDKMRKSNLFHFSQDVNHSYKNKIMDDKLSKQTVIESHKQEKKHDAEVPDENCKKSTQVKSSGDCGQGLKHQIFHSLSDSKKIVVQGHEGTSSTLPTQKMELLAPSSLRGKSEMRSPIINGISTDVCDNRHTFGTNKVNEKENRNVYTSVQDDSFKEPKSDRKADSENGGLPTTSKHSTPAGHKVKDINAPSPARRDSNQSATGAIKEAKTLKHMADRLKTSGSNAERIGLYFQASLKFLLGASLLESSTSDSKHGEIIQSTQMYSSTANLCKFCANEYEKGKDMASAALAYKCTEVAYMRVIYASHNNVNKDRHELAQDVNFAMDASRKSRVALAAVGAHLGQIHNEEGISSIKRALDFSFQDIEGLLRLIRLAMEAISR